MSARCKCHSSYLYDSLTRCPVCGHWSLDEGRTWKGCERKACGAEWLRESEAEEWERV